MRIPKIEALHRVINENYNSFIVYLCLDEFHIDSNSWLAGFTDGNFSITVYDRKKKMEKF